MAVDWLKRPHTKPFLLMLGHKAPHSFYTPEPKYAHTFDNVDIQYPQSAFMLDDKPDWMKQRITTWHGIYGPLFEWRKNFPDTSKEGVKDFANMTRGYWGCILSVDDSTARLFKTLEEIGQLDNTMIIFMGDNGLLNGEDGMVDKRAMQEASLRVPLLVRYPGLTPTDKPKMIEQLALTEDLAPSILDICHAAPLPKVHGRSWKALVQGTSTDWRKSFLYEYNYEKQFPYTPNVRGVRADEWAYMHYPHGDGNPDRHMAELYNLKSDPEELHNLINDPAQAGKVEELKKELDRLLKETDAVPDQMPMDEGVKSQLPDQKIR
jgi:N-acetylglucosamine-6-sulfatase